MSAWYLTFTQKNRTEIQMKLELPGAPILQKIIEREPFSSLTFSVPGFDKPFCQREGFGWVSRLMRAS